MGGGGINRITRRNGLQISSRPRIFKAEKKDAQPAIPLAYFHLLNHRFIECFQCNSLHVCREIFLHFMRWRFGQGVVTMANFLFIFVFFIIVVDGNCVVI